MFLYRLAKICAEARLVLPIADYINCVLLTLLDDKNSVTMEMRYALSDRDDDTSREFHYLEGRFNELGLDADKLYRAVNPIPYDSMPSIPPQARFRNSTALTIALAYLKKLGEELDRLLQQNQQVAGVLLDYVMIYHELLTLELQSGSFV
jgi:hypothetical protein